MNIKEKYLNISKTLFFLLVLIIPLNLGKHIVINDAYVWGILIDYLIPTVYVQDIIAVLIVFFWILGTYPLKISLSKFFERREMQFSSLFIFSSLFSVLSAQRVLPSLYFWIRLSLYFLLFVYITKEISIQKHFFKVLSVVSLSVLLSGLLGIFQFIKQGAVFNNYLFFGEQPYSVSTWGVVHKEILDHFLVPAYGTFRHSNTFGGFLCVFLLWLLPYLKNNRKYLISFIVGSLALVFTLSYSAWLVFVLGIFLHVIFSINVKKIKYKKILISRAVMIFCVALLIIPVFSVFSKSLNPSIFRRSDLLTASYRLIGKYTLFGVGLNNFTVLVDMYAPHSSDIRFTQPVHNVFALVLAETGVFTFAFFVVFLFLGIRKTLTPGYFHVLFISLMQILILMSFDHYFLTINQTLLMFWIIMGLVFSESY